MVKEVHYHARWESGHGKTGTSPPAVQEVAFTSRRLHQYWETGGEKTIKNRKAEMEWVNQWLNPLAYSS
jgi:hypothetical protein